MANLSGTVTYDVIGSLTNPKIAQKISDNITKKIPLLFFYDRAGHKEYESGGSQYQLPVFKEMQTAQWYTGLTPLTTAEADPVTTAIYQRKQVTVPIIATGTKMLQNSGNSPETVVSYLETIVETAQESVKDALANSTDGLFSTNGESDTGLTGLGNIVADSTTSGTVGGLDRSVYSWWRQQTQSVTTGWNTDGLLQMALLFYNCTRGDESPTVGVMTESGYNNLNRSLTATLQYNVNSPDTQFADIAFQHINFHGTPIVYSTYCPANRLFFLNMKYMKLLVHRDRDMVIRDWITPTDQDALVARLYWAGNQIAASLARQGVLQGPIETW